MNQSKESQMQDENPLDNISQDSYDSKQVGAEKENLIQQQSQEIDKFYQKIDQTNNLFLKKSKEGQEMEEEQKEAQPKVKYIYLDLNQGADDNQGNQISGIKMNLMSRFQHPHQQNSSEPISFAQKLDQFQVKYQDLLQQFQKKEYQSVLLQLQKLSQSYHPFNYKHSAAAMSELVLPCLVKIYNLAMMCHFYQQQYAKAIDYAELIIFLSDSDLNAHKIKSICHLRLKQTEQAANALKLIHKKFQGNAEALRLFTEVEMELARSSQINLKRFFHQFRFQFSVFSAVTLLVSLLITFKKMPKARKITSYLGLFGCQLGYMALKYRHHL